MPVTVGSVAPVTGTVLAQTTPILFEVSGVPNPLQRCWVFAQYPGLPTTEVIWDGYSFTDQYSRTSTTATTATGRSFGVVRTPVWPDTPTIRVFAVSTTLEELSYSGTWGIATASGYIPSGGYSPVYTTGAPFGASGSSSHTQAYFHTLISNLLDGEYVRPLTEGTSSGDEMLQAFSAVAERLSVAAQRFEDDNLIQYAANGEFATGTVEFVRSPTAPIAVTIKAGTIVWDGKRPFRTLEDCVFAAPDNGPIAVPIKALVKSYQWNLPGQVITSSGITIEGPINDCLRMYQDPPFADMSVRVRQLAPTVGGEDPALELLALDRGITRRPGESDSSLRYRIRNIEATITPKAVIKLLHEVLSPYTMGWDLIETYEKGYQTCFDVSASTTGLDTNLFTFDDTRAAYPFRNRWLDETEHVKAFIAVVQKSKPIRDYGAAYDLTYTTDHAFGRHVGYMATAFFDSTRTVVSGIKAPWAFDMDDIGLNAVYSSLWQSLQKIRAAGVTAALEMRGQ